MTYEESYMECETIKDLEKEIANDIKIAMMVNPDRLKPIGDAGQKVAHLKFGGKIKST